MQFHNKIMKCWRWLTDICDSSYGQEDAMMDEFRAKRKRPWSKNRQRLSLVFYSSFMMISFTICALRCKVSSIGWGIILVGDVIGIPSIWGRLWLMFMIGDISRTIKTRKSSKLSVLMVLKHDDEIERGGTKRSRRLNPLEVGARKRTKTRCALVVTVGES